MREKPDEEKVVFKCLNNHVSSLFSELHIRRQSSSRANTRASINGDCLVDLQRLIK